MITGKKRLARSAAWVGLAIVSSACGGQARSSSGEHPLPAAGGASSAGSAPIARGAGGAGGALNTVGGAAGSVGAVPPPAVSTGGADGWSSDPSRAGAAGEAGEPTATVGCAASAEPLRAELLWQDVFNYQGSSDYPFFGFSPDGSQLVVPIAESANQQGNRSYGVASGELLAPLLPAVLGRDAGWSRQLLSMLGVAVHFDRIAEVASGQALLSFGPEQARPLQVRLSNDGQYLFRLSCEQGLRVERLRLSDSGISSVALGGGESLCVGNDYGHPTFILPLTASRTNDQVLVGAERRGFALVDFMSGSATFSVPPDDPATALERKPNQPLPSDLLTLELGPEERTLAAVDASGKLRLLSYPELVQTSPEITTAVSSAFAEGYVTRRNLAPIAWSADERYLATADDAHATVVRRACDGSVAVTLPAPVPDPTRAFDDQHWVPAFLAFNRRNFALAVLSTNKKLAATVSYYRLSIATPN